MVRLKVLHLLHCFLLILFQFQYGTIKRTTQLVAVGRDCPFQFQYGTIKSTSLSQSNSISSSFNSSMVRLKVPPALVIRFRQHFQFQYGTIKSVFAFSGTVLLIDFQFQYGTIKSFDLIRITLIYYTFNSSMVRLKGCSGSSSSRSPRLSIPVWYD